MGSVALAASCFVLLARGEPLRVAALGHLCSPALGIEETPQTQGTFPIQVADMGSATWHCLGHCLGAGPGQDCFRGSQETEDPCPRVNWNVPTHTEQPHTQVRTPGKPWEESRLGQASGRAARALLSPWSRLPPELSRTRPPPARSAPAPSAGRQRRHLHPPRCPLPDKSCSVAWVLASSAWCIHSWGRPGAGRAARPSPPADCSALNHKVQWPVQDAERTKARQAD